MFKLVYEAARWVYSALAFAGMMGVAGLMMYLALHRSADLLQDRLYEEKRAWAWKWLTRTVLWLFVALGLLVLDGMLSPL